MSAKPVQRHLEAVGDAPELLVVNPATGETTPIKDHMQPLHDEIAGLNRDISGWRARHAELKRDKLAEALQHPLWPEGLKLFDFWRVECKHPRSQFTQERFWLALPYLGPAPEALKKAAKELGIDEPDSYGPTICRMAIRGAAFDCYQTKRRNGTTKRHDGWDLIFRDADKVEEFACRAPREQDG